MSTFRLWQERLKTVRLYYKSLKFAFVDLTFGLIGLFQNPYRVCRKFLQRAGEENIHAYGETPYTTYEKIAKEVGVTEKDTWIELGAGRGKGCFWLSHFTACRVIGVEQIPQFVKVAKGMKSLFKMDKIEFIKGNIEEVDLSSATIIYLYGLWPNLKLKKGTKIITTSEPLEGMRVIKQFWVRFPWGRTTAYLQEK